MPTLVLHGCMEVHSKIWRQSTLNIFSISHSVHFTAISALACSSFSTWPDRFGLSGLPIRARSSETQVRGRPRVGYPLPKLCTFSNECTVILVLEQACFNNLYFAPDQIVLGLGLSQVHCCISDSQTTAGFRPFHGISYNSGWQSIGISQLREGLVELFLFQAFRGQHQPKSGYNVVEVDGAGRSRCIA